MEIIEKNDISLLSHIIYTIYNTENIDHMRLEILKLLRYAVPFDTANFFLVESDADNKQMLTRPINVNTLINSKVEGVLKDYMEKCSELDCTHWVCAANKNRAYRTTDYLSEATLENTDYYKEMFSPYDVHYGAQLVLAYNNTCVGLLTCFRSKKAPNFLDKEIFYFDCLKEHLSIRLYQSAIQNKTSGYHSAEYIKKYNLTQKESEILVLLFEGLTNESISEKLFISGNTLRKHMYNIFNKLGIKHRWELTFLK
jgi:DNA-binding CsgD family transcriptional regulator